MIKKLICIGLILSSGINVSNALTLQEAIDQTMQKSPVIQKAASIKAEASWKKRENYSSFLPTVSANAIHLFDKKLALSNIRLGNSSTDTIVPQIIPASQLTLTATLPLFEGFSSLNYYRASLENENATNNQLSWTQLKTEMDVTLAFYKALASKTLKEVAEQNLHVLQDHLKEIQNFKQSGMATNYDVLRVEVQVSNAETDLLSAIDNISTSEQNLFEAMGLDKAELQLTGELPKLNESILNNISDADINSRADIRAFKNQITALSFTDNAKKSYWIPRLSLIGQYQYYNNITDSLSDTDKFRSAYQIGFQLNWNIFDGLNSFAHSKQTTEQFIQAEKSYRITEIKAHKDFEIQKRKYNYFLSLYKARNNDIAKAKESVRLAKEGRRVGARTNTDLLDAEADLYKSQAGAVNAQLGAIEELINLQTTIGHKF